jgi:hypothetical protein
MTPMSNPTELSADSTGTQGSMNCERRKLGPEGMSRNRECLWRLAQIAECRGPDELQPDAAGG